MDISLVFLSEVFNIYNLYAGGYAVPGCVAKRTLSTLRIFLPQLQYARTIYHCQPGSRLFVGGSPLYLERCLLPEAFALLRPAAMPTTDRYKFNTRGLSIVEVNTSS